MSEPKSIHEEWLQKVEEDEFASREILDGKRFPAPACFHAHQMAEKALKALILFQGQEFPHVHDLVALAALIEPLIPNIKDLKEDLTLLDQYYVETRYPGNYPEFTNIECQEALEAALRIKEFVLEKTK